MPYLTLWDKIAQNLAHLEANSHKIFQSLRIFRPSYNILYKEININHTFLCLLQASYVWIKALYYFLGRSKMIFVKISQNFIKSPLNIALTHSFQSIAYGMFAFDRYGTEWRTNGQSHLAQTVKRLSHIGLRICHPYQLDDSTCHLRAARCLASFWFYFEYNFLLANCGVLDQTPRSAASDLGLPCFPMSLLWDARNIWFNIFRFYLRESPA